MRLALGLLLFLMLAALVIQVTPIQDYLTGKLTHYLQEKLDTEVQIDGIRLRLLESLVLKGVYVEDRQQDTLLNVDELAVNFTLHQLVLKRIQFDKIRLKGGVMHMITEPDGSSNIDFILEAFGTGDEAPPKEKTNAPWRIIFDNAPLDIQKVDFRIQDATNAFLLDIEAGRLEGLIKEIDLQEQVYRAKRLSIANTSVRLDIGESTAAPPTTAEVKQAVESYASIFTEAYEVDLRSVNFDLKLPDLELGTYVEELAFNYGSFVLDENDMIIQADYLHLDGSSFYYDVPSAPFIEGYDYNHFSLEDVAVEVAKFDFKNLVFSADVLHASATEKKGFRLNDLQSKCYFYHDSIRVEDLFLLTKGSRIRGNDILLSYPMISETSAPLSQMGLAFNINADTLSPQEGRFFYPGMDSLDFYQNNKKSPVRLKAQASGTLRDFAIPQVDFKSKNTHLRFNGNLQNLTEVDKLGFQIDIKQLETNAKGVKEWLPPGTIPESVMLPAKIDLAGKVGGNVESFQTNIKGHARRTDQSDKSKLKAHALIQKILVQDSTYFDIVLDTLFTNRSDLQAYLPAGSLPEYVELPESVLLTGKARGTYADMSTELKILTYREGTTSELTAIGNIGELLQSDKTYVDLKFESLGLTQKELMAYLPDSLLPTYLQLPIIQKLTGFVRGNSQEFVSDLSFQSNTGKWNLKASMNESNQYDVNLKVDDFLAEAFFTENEYQQRVGIPIAPWSVRVDLKGKGLDPEKEMQADLMVRIKKAGDNTMDGLVIEGTLGEKVLRARAMADEPELQLNADFMLDYRNKIPETELSLDLQQLDIQQLRKLEKPLAVSGNLEAKVDGYSLDTLSGALLMDDIHLTFDQHTHTIDGLLGFLKMDNGENYLNLTSDVFTAELGGWFRLPEMQEAMEQQLQSYFRPEYPDSLIGNTRDSFEFAFELLRPELFTTGLVPGLEELAPFKLTAAYDNNIAFMEAHALIPYASWNGVLMDTLGFDLTLGNGIGDYIFRMENVNMFDVVNFPMFEVAGTYMQEWIANQLIIFDEQKEERFGLRANFQAVDNNTFNLQLEEDQLVDYQQWSVSKNNNIRLSGKEISVRDWRFYHGKEVVDIVQVADNQLKMRFEQFDLDLIAQTLRQDANYLGGILNGTITVWDALEKPRLYTDFDIDSLQVLDAGLGDLNLLVSYDENSHINTSAHLDGRGNDVKIVGTYNIKDPVNAIDSFKLDVRRLYLPTLEPMLSAYLSKVQGVMTGNVVVTGNFAQPALLGQISFDSTAFNVDMLQTRLRLGNEPIVFDANAIEFQDLQVFDALNNRATVSAYLLTEDYREYVLSTEISAKNFLVLNTTADDNDLYYGKMVVDAEARLSGRTSEPVIDIAATPKKGSNLTYVYSAENAQIESHTGIVDFVNPEEDERRRRLEQEQVFAVSDDLNLEIRLRATVNKDLDFKVITNPITGDYFQAKAKGDLSFAQYPDGEMELVGGLEVVEGKYLFTYQEVVRRPFELVPGSTLTWTGDPYNPNLDLQVRYEVRTSPYPLFANQEGAANNSNLSRRQLFYVLLDIGGTATRTEIKSSIEYPEAYGNTGDSDIEAVIQQINLDESSQNTQAFALILFNGFIGQNIGNSDLQVVDLQGNVNNLITQQLNNLANRYIKFVELDFGLDTYEEAAGTRSDFRFSVRKRFLNDRLSINIDGVTTSESGQDESSSQTYLDNITVEYSLTPDGRFRVKVYNQRDFDDFIGQTGIKVGGALVFSKDFKHFRFFGKKEEED